MTQGTPLVSQNDCPVHGAVGTVEHYGAFVRLCRARIDELGVTYETVDELAGFSARYTATIRSNSGSCSVYSLFTLARTLALLPVFQHDAAELERLRRRSAWIMMQRRGRVIGRARTAPLPNSPCTGIFTGRSACAAPPSRMLDDWN
jgi:hypothetical protein